MDDRLLSRATEEFNFAKEALLKMKDERSPRKAKRYWSDFLNHMQRAYNRLGGAAKDGRARGWYQRLQAQRSADPLMQYLHQARHADEHGIEEVSDEFFGSIEIGSGSYVESFSVDNRRVTSSKVSGNVKITLKHELVPVKNRGVTYPIPDAHLGKEMDLRDPIHAGKLALDYLSLKIEEAKATK